MFWREREREDEKMKREKIANIYDGTVAILQVFFFNSNHLAIRMLGGF